MMKNKTHTLLAFLLMMLATALTSCEKFALDEEETKNEESGKIVADENHANVCIQTSKTEGNRMSFAIFDVEDKIANVNQTKGDANFGTAYFNLEDGEYRLVVIAHNGKGNCTISQPESVKFSNNKLTDTFYYYGRLDVNGGKTSLNVDLARAVAAFHVHIQEDDIPDSIKVIKFYYTGGSSTLDATTGYGCVNSRQTETFKISNDARDFVVYTFPHNIGSVNMDISFLDANADIVKSSYDNILPLKVNKTYNWIFSIRAKNSLGSWWQDGIWKTGDEERPDHDGDFEIDYGEL